MFTWLGKRICSPNVHLEVNEHVHLGEHLGEHFNLDLAREKSFCFEKLIFEKSIFSNIDFFLGQTSQVRFSIWSTTKSFYSRPWRFRSTGQNGWNLFVHFNVHLNVHSLLQVNEHVHVHQMFTSRWTNMFTFLAPPGERTCSPSSCDILTFL
jgi:hypothetical protein